MTLPYIFLPVVSVPAIQKNNLQGDVSKINWQRRFRSVHDNDGDHDDDHEPRDKQNLRIVVRKLRPPVGQYFMDAAATHNTTYDFHIAIG
jgi:hypothetical protein